ncbi:alpha/beta fold hydrolase [Caloramator sp. CAR-1]|uniref:alpha/beta hydrolase n=1 Tax=Caloramator sp. CAR-1 TaxID=3062777 RepID=UPI0026E449B6|nr:alpha/beta fold hydrolase [Caloramator sp. CAR-1]MDO6354703.1 alpha/beta fold hydrolase [Caloramator sp. CAR-1]
MKDLQLNQEDLRREYFLKGREEGCLLIHGFTSTPAELRELGHFLNEKGYTVYGVRLHGHGTSIDEMERSTFKDWIKSVEGGLNFLKESCSKIYVIGHSMGSLLALYIAENYDIDKVVALSPPLILKNKTGNFAFIIKYFMRYAKWPPEERPEEEKKYLLGYDKIPVKSIHEFNKLNRLVKKNLKKVKSPLFIVQSEKDSTVDIASVDYLYNAATSSVKQKCILKKCGHNITIECEKHDVFNAVYKFLNS